MAKQDQGIIGGFRGTIGPVIGYQWRGRWCLRARPQRVANPRTAAQQEHRMLFRDMVRLASRLTPVLRRGLRDASLQEGMTEGNLFVRMNKGLFSAQGVDYGRLAVSHGPVAPVAFTHVALDERMVVRCEFEKNPLRMRADGTDEVWLYAYCPAVGRGILAAPVQRRTKHLEAALPDEWAGNEVHLYAFVTDHAQRASSTLYLVADAPGDADGSPDVDAADALRAPSAPSAQAVAAQGATSAVQRSAYTAQVSGIPTAQEDKKKPPMMGALD